MSRKQFFALFLCNLTPFIVGAGALPLLLGRLSDWVGRERLLVLSYLASAASMALLALSSSLWQFWLAAGLVALSGGISSSLGQALTTDLVPPESLARGLSLYGITVRLGSVIGSAGTGHAVARLGLAPTMVASALLPLIAIALIAAVRQARTAESPDMGRA